VRDGRPLVAVFGAGRIGRVHAKNLASYAEADFAGVADIDTTAAERVVNELGKGRVRSVDAFLGDTALDAVVIATPTSTHADVIAQVAAAGKHIFCEKPISLEIDTTIEAIALCERSGSILQIGFQRHFDRDFLKAHEAIESGRLGEIRFMRLVSRDRTLPPIEYIPTSGGQYKDQMVHDFDAARWLMAPASVDDVTAVGGAIIDPAIGKAGDIDTALALLKFSNGAFAIIDVSREAAYGYDVRTEILGSQGMLLTGGDDIPDGIVLGSSHVKPRTDSFITRFTDAYRREIEAFVDVVAAKRTPPVVGSDALEALRIAVAADRSLRERRTVRLGEVPGAVQPEPA
jgi:myo-inositol 2-dehydrogenase / D-chiro-inositol 1-dehydrogenase